jgi:hypothetical protein
MRLRPNSVKNLPRTEFAQPRPISAFRLDDRHPLEVNTVGVQAMEQHHTQTVLRRGLPLERGTPIPFERLGVILRGALPQMIHQAQDGFRLALAYSQLLFSRP